MGRVGEVDWDLSYLPPDAFSSFGHWLLSKDEFFRHYGSLFGYVRFRTWTVLGITFSLASYR